MLNFWLVWPRIKKQEETLKIKQKSQQLWSIQKDVGLGEYFRR